MNMRLFPRFVTANTVFGTTSRGTLSVPFEQMKFDADGIEAHVSVPLLQAGLKNHFSRFIVSEGISSIIAFLTPVTVN
jgi:hypothetical protein